MTRPLSFDTLENRLRVQGTLEVCTGLRIGVGRDMDIVGHDLPVIRNAAGRPFIPGSSFKGVLRANLEAALRGLSEDCCIQQLRLACMVLAKQKRCIPDTRMQGWRARFQNKPDALAQHTAKKSCLICQTLGSPWIASHVAIRDMPVEEDFWFDQFGIRQGVALDRDTGTARDAFLYSFETVPPGTRFMFEIEADNLQAWQKGLLWFGLQPFVRGEASLGGARSRGLGQVKLLEEGLRWEGWELGEQRVDSVLALLGDGPTPLADKDKEMKSWQSALRTKLQEVIGA